MNPEDIFEPDQHNDPIYGNDCDELERVISGEKPMLETEVPLEVATGSGSPIDTEWYYDMIETALQAELLVVLNPQTIPSRPPRTLLELVICRREQAWRIPAWVAAQDAFRHRRWTDGKLALDSQLLGYSAPEIENWLTRKLYQTAKIGFATVYAQLSFSDMPELQMYGMKSFPPRIIDSIAFWAAPRMRLKSDLERHLAGIAFLRVAVDYVYYNTKLGESTAKITGSPTRLRITDKDASELNAALRGSIERWTPAGWVA